MLAGASEPASGQRTFALTRYTVGGALDTSFSGDGKLTTDFTPLEDGAESVAVQRDGKIVAAGFNGTNFGLDPVDFALARYRTNGTLDTGFSGDGKQTTDIDAGSADAASDLVIQPDGPIVLSGVAGAGANGDFALTRYQAGADLRASLTDSPDPVARGAMLTYRATARNAGPDQATGVRLTQVLPPGVTFVSVSTTRGRCTRSGRTITCTLGTLDNGAAATATVRVRPTTAGTKSSTARVSGDQAERVAASNAATTTTRVR